MNIFEPPSCESKFIRKNLQLFGNRHYIGQKFTFDNDIYELTSDVNYRNKYNGQDLIFTAKIPDENNDVEYKFKFLVYGDQHRCQVIGAQGGGKKKQSRKQKKSLKRKPRKQKKSLKKRR